MEQLYYNNMHLFVELKNHFYIPTRPHDAVSNNIKFTEVFEKKMGKNKIHILQAMTNVGSV